MKNKLKLMLGFICFAVFVTVAHGQAAPGARNRAAGTEGGNFNIRGRVVMPDGSGARNVKVSISSVDSGSSSVITDDDGAFQTGNVSAGNYTLSVNVPGYAPENEYLTVDAAMGTNYNVALYVRMAGQKKGDIYSMNPLFKDVPKTALDKFKKAADKLHANDAKTAIPLFDEAIADYPNFAAAYYELGTAYLKENNLDKALESFVKAISIKSDYTDAKYSVGYVQYLKNNFEVSAAVFDDVLKTKEMPEAHLYLGISLVKLHNIDASIPHFKAAVAKKDDASVAMAHRYLGGIYIQKKQNADAAAELQKYLDLVPKAPDADKLRATIADLRKGS